MLEDIRIMKCTTSTQSAPPTIRKPNGFTSCATVTALYVIDEAIESHGMVWRTPLAKDSTWKAAHVFRVRNMYRAGQKPAFHHHLVAGQRSRQRSQFDAAYDYLKAADNNRPAIRNKLTEGETPTFSPHVRQIGIENKYDFISTDFVFNWDMKAMVK